MHDQCVWNILLQLSSTQIILKYIMLGKWRSSRRFIQYFRSWQKISFRHLALFTFWFQVNNKVWKLIKELHFYYNHNKLIFYTSINSVIILFIQGMWICINRMRIQDNKITKFLKHLLIYKSQKYFYFQVLKNQKYNFLYNL